MHDSLGLLHTRIRRRGCAYLLAIIAAATSILASQTPAQAQDASNPQLQAAPAAAPPSPASVPAPSPPAAAQAAAADLGEDSDPLRRHPWSADVLLGSSFAIKGLNYNFGAAARVGVNLRHVYLGGFAALHQGDNKKISWGPDAFSSGGDQKYSSHPLFFAADAGYSFVLPIGSLDSVFTPCLSGGLLLITMDTSGVYGSSSIVNTYGIFGFGVSEDLLFGERFFAGVHFRLYDTGDTSFEFGNLSQGTYQHGFSTSIFYYALYSELGLRF
jgi:hypothetical protein